MFFVLDRRNGEPLVETVERAVPQGPAPGIRLSPTQPYPVGMPSFGGEYLTEATMWGITLVPNTLAECMAERPAAYTGQAEPLAIAGANAKAIVTQAENVAAFANNGLHPHFVDTRAIPWIDNPAVPGMGLNVLRVSEETGITSLIVKHNGVAGPHYHLGAADFLVLSGRIGYRAGPPEGYGPGVWFYEPAGARHEATQRVGEDDLIYTANIYGPLQFDEGKGYANCIGAVLDAIQRARSRCGRRSRAKYF